ncbi:MAG TPA: sigma-70 family RNA polymerase sigma factor [Firmicutes bacterium]|nr:sigma-70 family RNA polymerase sigma factor [Candidatus Fermentithermobacillaceae bacterium]
MVAEDLVLAKCASQGDQEAFERIYETYYKQVYHHILRMVRDKYEAEDLTQEVFMRAYQFMGTYSGNAALGRWLRKIATNLCIDKMRKRTLPTAAWPTVVSKDGDEQPVDFPDDGLSPADIAQAKEAETEIRLAIGLLPDCYRDVVILRDLMDRSGEEIANEMSCPIGTVKSRLSRGHELLRQRFAPALGIVS